jgi:hypothetical protein
MGLKDEEVKKDEDSKDSELTPHCEKPVSPLFFPQMLPQSSIPLVSRKMLPFANKKPTNAN